MSIARDGFPLIIVALVVTVATYALALQRRSWSLWLLAFGLTVASLWVTWLVRDSEHGGARGEHVHSSPADGCTVDLHQGARPGLIRIGSRVDLFLPAGAEVRAVHGQTTTAGVTIFAELPRV